MTPADAFLLLVRWLHVVAAVAWVGGNLFYLLVLVPALRKPDLDLSAIGPRIAARFRVVVDGYEDGYDDLSPEQLRMVRISLNTGTRDYVGAHDDVGRLPEEKLADLEVEEALALHRMSH